MGRVTLRAIVPKPFNAKVIREALTAGMKEYNDIVLSDFQATTAGWETEVAFSARVAEEGGGLVAEVTTENEIYGYVNDGTRPHDIFPKNAKFLRFGGGGYVAKTVPGVVGSRPGNSGGAAVFTKHVKHPGTAARGFDIAIKNRRKGDFYRILFAAVVRGAVASGYG